MTDALQAIAENTAVPASYRTEGKAGKIMPKRWADKDIQRPVDEERTAEEIISHIKEKLEEVT